MRFFGIVLLLIVIALISGCETSRGYGGDATLVKGSYPVAEFTGFFEDLVICSEVAKWLNDAQKRDGHASRDFYCIPSSDVHYIER